MHVLRNCYEHLGNLFQKSVVKKCIKTLKWQYIYVWRFCIGIDIIGSTGILDIFSSILYHLLAFYITF